MIGGEEVEAEAKSCSGDTMWSPGGGGQENGVGGGSDGHGSLALPLPSPNGQRCEFTQVITKPGKQNGKIDRPDPAAVGLHAHPISSSFSSSSTSTASPSSWARSALAPALASPSVAFPFCPG